MKQQTNQSALFISGIRLASLPASDNTRRAGESPRPELIAGYGGASGRFMEVWTLWCGGPVHVQGERLQEPAVADEVSLQAACTLPPLST